MEELVKDILRKKELKNLDETTVVEELNKFFKKNKEVKKILEEKSFNKKSAQYKWALKEVRKKLREIYGVFIQKDYEKRESFLKKLNKNNGEEILPKLLRMHISTKERLPYYKEIYEQIFKITGKQKIILDLACGLNPLSYNFLGYKPKYIASDIAKKDLEFIQSFFSKNKIDGKSVKIDLVTEQKKIEKIKSDICFLFKALDSLETRKRHISKELIEKITAKWIVISFSKASLGGNRNIAKNKRSWVTNFLKKKGFLYREFEVANEFFFVVKKD
ncbi:MAG: hypothetical protein ABH828_04990 [archaeon]